MRRSQSFLKKVTGPDAPSGFMWLKEKKMVYANDLEDRDVLKLKILDIYEVMLV